MRNILLLLLTILTLGLNAQTQHGYVKTKGRLNAEGEVIPGERLEGASILVKDRSAVVSGDEGTFSIKLANSKYYLMNIKKQGYTLTDMEDLSQEYSYSKENPHIIVMETMASKIDDELMVEDKTRANLEARIKKQRAEIDKLKAENKITQEEYRNLLMKLNEERNTNEKLIQDMVERYSKIDYDQLDEFNLQVSKLILNGELAKADSLINTKGNLISQVSQYHQGQRIIQERQEEINEAQRELDKTKQFSQKELEELAERCYNKFEIFKMQHNNDSAAYYIELRAALDTTNAEWQSDAGNFVEDYLAQYDKALNYYEKALKVSNDIYRENHPIIASCHNTIGYVYSNQGKYAEALKYFEKALDIWKENYGENHPNVAVSYNNIGSVYSSQRRDTEALEYHEKALKIRKEIYGENHPNVAESYHNIGYVYSFQGRYAEALEYFEKTLDIWKEFFGEDHQNFATSYTFIGLIYSSQGRYTEALEYNEKALKIRKEIYGENHPEVAESYYSIGAIYSLQGHYTEALYYFKKALDIKKQVYGENHPVVASCYHGIGFIYSSQGKYSEALKYHDKALDIYNEIYEKNHPNVIKTQKNIASIYYTQKDWENFNEQLPQLAFTITFAENDTTEVSSELQGEYYLLEFADWNQDLNINLFDKEKELKDKSKSILVMKDGNISQHQLDGSTEVKLNLKYVGKEEKQKIVEAYNQWEKNNKKK